MKKILSILLAAVMLIACIPSAIFAASGSGHGWQWDDSVSYGYIKNFGSFSPSDVIIEFDASVVRGGEGAKFELWTDGPALTLDCAANTISAGTLSTRSITWGELSGNNWKHLTFKFNGGTASVAIDGNEVISVAGVTARTDNSIILMSNHGYLTIDNFKVSTNSGSVLYECDFEDAADAQAHFGEGLGGIVEVQSIPEAVETSIGWVARVDDYAHLGKGIDKCDDYPEWNCGTVEFDMWMIAGSSGAAKVEFLEGYEGCVRINILNNAVGYFYTWTEEERLTSFNWGPLNLQNKRHVKYAHSDTDVKLYIDDQLVYTIGYGCTPAMEGLVVLVSEGIVFIDNLVFTDSLGGVHGSFDMDSQWPDNDSAERVYVGDCDTYGHTPASSWIRRQDPDCTNPGYDVKYCLACAEEALRQTVPALGHAYGNYSDGRVVRNATATADGQLAWTCSRCRNDAATGSIVATGDYKGTIFAYDDFSNEELTKYILKGFVYEANENGRTGEVKETSEDGNDYLHSNTEGTYREFFPAVPTSGFTVSFDFCLNEIFSNGDTNSYGHEFYYWFGGLNEIFNQAGYSFDTGEFFIRPTDGTSYRAVTAKYDLKEDVWYNISFKYYADNSTFEAWCAFLVNGVEVARFDDIDAAFSLPYDDYKTNANLFYRTFGVDANYDNFVLGDVDFEWINYRTPANTLAVPGDLNGDGVVNAVDSMLLKAYLVGDTSVAIIAANADVNGDGKINARDSRALRLILGA